jgi:hypothetical protein
MLHFTDRAIRIVAEDKIQSALKAGAFDHLPGLGKPLELINEPYDDLWWVRSKAAVEEIKLRAD